MRVQSLTGVVEQHAYRESMAEQNLVSLGVVQQDKRCSPEAVICMRINFQAESSKFRKSEALLDREFE